MCEMQEVIDHGPFFLYFTIQDIRLFLMRNLRAGNDFLRRRALSQRKAQERKMMLAIEAQEEAAAAAAAQEEEGRAKKKHCRRK